MLGCEDVATVAYDDKRFVDVVVWYGEGVFVDFEAEFGWEVEEGGCIEVVIAVPY